MTAQDEAGDHAYVAHMLEAIGRVQRYLGRKGRAAFLKNSLLQDAVIRNIEVIGEAAGRVSPAFSAKHPAIPWRKIVGTRHRLIHGYLSVNLDTVWEAAARDLPALETGLRGILGPTGIRARRSRGRKRRKR